MNFGILNEVQIKEYIDRDSLIKSVKRSICSAKKFERNLTDEEFLELIKTEPLIGTEEDLKPVLHAYWIDTHKENSTGKIFKCSNCGKWHNPNSNDVELHRVFENPLYCSSCGSKMDFIGRKHNG